jgi:hypothetical protein
MCVGFVLATIFHGARWALDVITRRGIGIPARPTPGARPARPHGAVLPRLSPLAEGWSGRGPPAGSIYAPRPKSGRLR